MRVGICAVGRMKAGPERDLAGRYLDRFAKSGPAVGLEFSGLNEFAESRARGTDERRREESRKIREMQADGAAIFLLDERGKNLTSEAFSTAIADLRDQGRRQLVLVIGGPDGHDPEFRQSAERAISFGAQTWPHQLVRVMLAEQLYRAATILSGHPYHRA
ncbi:23S rRNA (pseudouridine(1915)-N(3))-methyltransferase RlmH [Nitratireductor indicus]|uniref:Ribosomal RNA large subunit methyltransferase H n=1 Tax=Nitratireductor indicus C115 TaxID=1231190 RepID=K2NVL4_9HYPH|nr:23S rRNA (pseudouridine(1915)-N(3))-methyltransferase RlmH [Nitratireductor indicus]EKF41889.1 rRNA large subunit methyltransferase [Nitratireductor indicus C115]MDS1136702.1 23S rRNA (pseudouridine(1915)-N(3))-methyltransferase RlmH [Nitratireductor indicus]SFQ48615.1 23S rRNA (pseudouridine1915-N3)-methyltransferase [Nitratireductor indicus]